MSTNRNSQKVLAGAAFTAALLLGGLAAPAAGASGGVSVVPVSHDDQVTAQRARLATSTDSWAASLLRQARLEKSPVWLEEQAKHARLARSTDSWVAPLLRQQQVAGSTDSWAAELLRQQRLERAAAGAE